MIEFVFSYVFIKVFSLLYFSVESRMLTALTNKWMVYKNDLTSVTYRTDELGTVDGSLDLLMDTLFSLLAPLLALTKQVPSVLDRETEKKIWEACALHTPRFA